MFKEKSINSSQAEKRRIIELAGIRAPQLICFLALTEKSYPYCCEIASRRLGQQIMIETGVSLNICSSPINSISDGNIIGSHTWLEYDNVIIDPTDFQSNVIDGKELSFTLQTIMPNDLDNISELSEQARRDVFMNTWFVNSFKRYQENPNEKEKYFLLLNGLFRDEKILPDDYISELQRCFGLKLFYDKNNDEDNIYRAEYIESVALNDVMKNMARAALGHI